MLELKNIKKSYFIDRKQSVSVLKDINLSFRRGEFVSIVGESGCGKSTLMNIVGGLDFNYEGEVFIDKVAVKSFKDKARDDYRKNKIGFIFQSFNLIPHLSVLENVTIAMQLSSIPEGQRNKRATMLLENIGLKEHLKKKPNQLSGGQKQRVAIARALANDPDILLADEPTGALDSKTSEQILELLEEIAKEGKLIITVTHSDKVAAFSSRVVRLEDGKVIEDKELKEVAYKHYITEQIKSKNLSLLAAMKLAFNNMRLNAWRNTLVALGGAIGISSVVLMLALGSGMKEYIVDSMNANTNPLIIEVNKEADNDIELPGPPGINNIPFEEEDIQNIREIDKVIDVEKGTQLMMQSSLKEEDKSVDIQMLVTVNGSIRHKELLAGEYPEGKQMLLSESVVKSLDYTNESILGKTFTVVVIAKSEDSILPAILEEELTVSGIYDTESYGPMNQVTLIKLPFDTLESMHQEKGVDIEVTSVYAYAEDEEAIEEIKAEILEKGYAGSRDDMMLEVFMDFLSVATIVLTAMAAISLIVSAIMILVVLYISVVERTKEIGILRAIGARKQDIRGIFFSEAILIGIFAGLVGVIIAKLISVIGNSILMQQIEMELINVNIYYILIGIVLSIVVSVLAGVFPAARAARLDPVESLRYE